MESSTEMVVPLLHIRGCLVGSVQQGLHDVRAERMRTQILAQIQNLHPPAIILDFSVIPLVDSFLARIIFTLHRATRLMGSRLILVGLPNIVIISMVELGVNLADIEAARDIDAALSTIKGDWG